MTENKKLKYVAPSFSKVTVSSGERIAAPCTPTPGWLNHSDALTLDCYYDLFATYELPGSL
jgi:hypothetical protein